MKVLFYLGHPAQFHFSKHIIRKLKEHGHEVKILIKSKDILENLVVNEGFLYENIQPEVRRGRTRADIFFESIRRTIKVIRIARTWDADLLIGTDSSIAQAGYFLQKRAITVVEDDYAVIKSLARLTYPFTTTIVAPANCDVGKWGKKKVAYNGYMKLAYLHSDYFVPDETIVREYIDEENYWLIRWVDLSAHHDKGKNGLNPELIKRIIEKAREFGSSVYISSEHELDESLKKYHLNVAPEHIHHFISCASLVVSDSQSMSVEAAILGAPSIRFSDFVGKISVLEELEYTYQLTYGCNTNEPEKLMKHIEEIMTMTDRIKVFEERRQVMLNEKIDVTEFFVRYIESKLIRLVAPVRRFHVFRFKWRTIPTN
jgi:predicted glycosyltransferase